MYNFVMNPKVYKMLLELDNQLESSTESYFNWTREQKDALIGGIIDFFIPSIMTGKIPLDNIIVGFILSREQAVEEENYEHADIMTKCIDILRNLYFQVPKR